ncbi:hypothetical protein NQZ68_007676 [Dissostichus eleginoides]|nr:hypothetical protein NQZ68_007676 [Dissostichus eleginoides]
MYTTHQLQCHKRLYGDEDKQLKALLRSRGSVVPRYLSKQRIYYLRGDIFFKADSSYSNSAYACLLFQSVDAEDTHVMLAADGSQRKVASEMINMIND